MPIEREPPLQVPATTRKWPCPAPAAAGTHAQNSAYLLNVVGRVALNVVRNALDDGRWMRWGSGNLMREVCAARVIARHTHTDRAHARTKNAFVEERIAWAGTVTSTSSGSGRKRLKRFTPAGTTHVSTITMLEKRARWRPAISLSAARVSAGRAPP